MAFVDGDECEIAFELGVYVGILKEVAGGIKGHLWCDVDDVVFTVVHFLP